MQKANAFFLILLLGLTFFLHAQDDNDPSIETDWDDYSTDLYTRGDQTFTISLGVGFPTFFVRDGEIIENKIDPPVGGTGALNYNYYFGSRFFTGGDLSLLFLPTIANNTVFITSLGLKTGTQFIIGRFEFPLSMTLGMTIQTYLDLGYFGMYMKAGAAALFRVSHEWSFGLTSNWCWFPQWTGDKATSVDGHFVDLVISARYHF